jgi:tetratricopeptide (TPR) repeat protein
VRALLRDDKNYDSRFELWVLEARLLAALGEPDRAIALLDELLMGDERARLGRSKGVIHYHLANLIYQHEEDFERASAHFDSSGTAASAPPGSVRPENRLQAGFTREAILDARQRSQNFQSFTNVYLRVVEMDSLLRLGALSQSNGWLNRQKHRSIASRRPKVRQVGGMVPAVMTRRRGFWDILTPRASRKTGCNS